MKTIVGILAAVAASLPLGRQRIRLNSRSGRRRICAPTTQRSRRTWPTITRHARRWPNTAITVSACSTATPMVIPSSTTRSSTSCSCKADKARCNWAAPWPASGRHQPASGVGTRLDGGDRHPLGPGDIVHIPAGVPHAFLVPEGKHLTYVLLKIPGNAPEVIRWTC